LGQLPAHDVQRGAEALRAEMGSALARLEAE